MIPFIQSSRKGKLIYADKKQAMIVWGWKGKVEWMGGGYYQEA